MADKTIGIGLKIENLSEFDRQIQDIQNRIRRVTTSDKYSSGSNQGGSGGSSMNPAVQKVFDEQRKRDVAQLKRDEDQILKQLKEKDAMHTAMIKKIDEINKKKKEGLEISKQEKEMLQAEVKLAQDKINLAKSHVDVTKSLGGSGGGGGGDGGGAAAGGGGMFTQVLKSIGIGAIIKGAMDAIVTATGDIISRDRKISMDRGAALGVASKELNEQFQGRGIRGTFFAGERAKAMRAAAGEQRGEHGQTVLGNVLSTVGGAIGGGLAGAAFAGVGAIPGAIAGGIAGYGTRMATSEKARASVFDMDRFKGMMAKGGMEKYEQNLAAEKAKDPKASMALDYFEQNRENISKTQRMLGIDTDDEMFGRAGFGDGVGRNRRKGLYETQIESGQQYGGSNFNQANIDRQMQTIIGAGGTTAAGREMGGFAAGVERQFNVGNAGQTIGKLSGAGVSNTEDAYKKLLAEAVRLGVDTSKMPQEMERLTAMTAELATAGGGFSSGAVETMTAGITGFDKTSLEAAKGAEEIFKQTGKSASGYEGQMGMGYLQSKEAQELLGGKKLSSVDMNYVNQFSSTSSDQSIAELSKYLGIGEKEARKLVENKDLYKQTRTSEEDKAVKEYGTFLEGAVDKEGKGLTGEALREKLMEGEGKGAKLKQAAKAQITSSHGTEYSGLTDIQQDSLLTQRAKLGNDKLRNINFGEDVGGIVEQTLGKKDSRVATKGEGAEGTGDLVRIEAFSKNIDRLGKAAEAHSKHAEAYNRQFELFLKALKTGSDATGDIAKMLEGVAKDLEAQGLMSTKPAD